MKTLDSPSPIKALGDKLRGNDEKRPRSVKWDFEIGFSHVYGVKRKRLTNEMVMLK